MLTIYFDSLTIDQISCSLEEVESILALTERACVLIGNRFNTFEWNSL